MLHLQRASAGSGKTFALAKTFIRLLISTPAGDGRRRLRTPAELPEAASHILAVTFTNKATGEMQMRIVEKLAALADADTPGDTSAGSTDYLDDFMEEFSASRREICGVCRDALRHLLLGYSSFNVSTIDSFFQSILRTFAYETDLNDSYALEIDNAYIASVGLDAVLDATAMGGGADRETLFWIRRKMDRAGGTRWNVFQRSRNRHSLYQALQKRALNLDKEEFKRVRTALSDFFGKGGAASLRSLFDTVEGHRTTLLDRRRDAAAALRDTLEGAKVALSSLTGGKLNEGRIAKALDIRTGATFAAKFPEDTPGGAFPKTGRKKLCSTLSGATVADIDAAYLRFAETNADYSAFTDSSFMALWRLYSANLPDLVLLAKVEEKMKEFLDSTGTLQISDTSTLLRRIVGDDDVPFIYERTGTRLHHFLIDEFQDTSAMQWEIFEPLLKESLAQGHDNLIIGDAKQSIYRFRNADPSLISDVVPSRFDHDESADPIPATGPDPAKTNTNWRSALWIVEFNNYFFSRLSKEFTRHIEALYDNCIQPPSGRMRRDPAGYVELTVLPARQQTQEDSDTADDAGDVFEGFRRIGPLIGRLLERGYRMADIGILVVSNDDGQQVIDSLAEYNASLPEGATMIECISDQSLKIADSRAVRTIISGLQALSEGSREDRPATGHAARHQLQEAIDSDRLSEMVGRLQTLALPILVESITEAFVSPELRRTEARYIAAFLDAVMDYCETANSDIASFLAWWERKKGVLAVASPDDAEAVRVLTIHKAKGLEYKCVIIPEAAFTFGPARKSEWEWTAPDRVAFEAAAAEAGLPAGLSAMLPDYIPLSTERNLLEGTPHYGLWRDYQESVCRDAINLAYVAFTRAEYELYAFFPAAGAAASAPRENPDGTPADDAPSSIASYLERYCSDSADYIAESSDPHIISAPIEDLTPESPDDDGQTARERKWSYGTPLSGSRIAALRKSADGAENPDSPANDGSPEGRRRKLLEIDVYDVTRLPGHLEYKDESAPAAGGMTTAEQQLSEYLDPEADPVDEDTDPRSEGVLLHAVMQNVSEGADLDRALRRMRVSGRISASREEEWFPMLRQAIENVDKEHGWFSGRWKVLSERAVMHTAHIPDADTGTTRSIRVNHRPDRIMTNADGDAVVVDYKFGLRTDVAKYRRQVAAYISDLTATGLFRSVSGFLWYVKAGKIERVEPERRRSTSHKKG